MVHIRYSSPIDAIDQLLIFIRQLFTYCRFFAFLQELPQAKQLHMRITLLVVTFIVLFAGNCAAQRNNDSAAIEEARAAYKMISVDRDSALAIAEKELEQAQHTGDKRLAALAYKTRGWAWMHKGSYEKTFPNLLLSAKLFREVNDSMEEMNLYLDLGIAYSNHSEFTNSARYLILADSLAEKLNDVRGKAQALRQTGILHREQGQYKTAIPYFRESMEKFLSIHDTVNFFGAAGSLCILYISMSMPDSSLALCNIVAPLINAVRGRHYEQAVMQERYGDSWFGLSKYEKAMESYGKAYKLFAGEHDQADMAYEAMNLGKTLTRLRKYAEAEKYLLLSYRLNDSLKMVNYTPDAAMHLADLYQATGDWHKAYHWLEQRMTLMDSLQLAAQNDKAAQLQAQFEADKKEKEIALLKADQQLASAVLQRQKIIRNAAIAGSILLVFIGVLIINRYRAVSRARRLVELEKMRNTIARDLHDDMGSALSTINIISKVALATEGEKVNEHLHKILEHSGLILENMSDIVWTINPVNDTLKNVIFKMKEFAADIFDPLNIDHSFTEEGEFHHIKLGLQTRRDLYLIFKEAVNNAAKYSRCTKVAITISGDGKHIGIRIKDNGIGFCRDTIRRGNGLNNMEQRARRINGELTISSGPEIGTAVTLHV